MGHPAPQLHRNQSSRLHTIGRDGADPVLVYETAALLEAPNWTRDGAHLVFNQDGQLYHVAASAPDTPALIVTPGVTGFNNDHVLSADGNFIYASADGHIYRIAIAGGVPVRVSNQHRTDRHFQYFLHGISSDGASLSYVAVEACGDDPWGMRRVATLDLETGQDHFLTDATHVADGPEYSPDDCWIYFNMTARDAADAGHDLFRVAAAGGTPQQLTFDARSNWFPHVSPDGQWISYLSYAPGTAGHPANRDVEIRIIPASGGPASTLVTLFGGQGTINVNSWSPDGKRLAYVSYPIAAQP